MTSDPHPSGETLIASVQRALRLVDIVVNSSRPVTPKALATASGLTLGTTYNLVRTLIREGYLAAEPDGLVLASHFLGLHEEDSSGVFLARVREALNDVAEGLGATAYLSRYTDGEVHLVDIVDAKSSPRVDLWVGMQSSAHATALGKQILAELPAEERSDYLSRHSLDELTPFTISDRRVLLQQLEQPSPAVVDRQEYAIGFTCLAVPVRAPSVTASLAVSLPVHTDDTDSAAITALAARLRGIANRLSLRLGGDRFGQSAQ